MARKLGVAVGDQGYALAETLRIVGSAFVQLLKALVPPLVFTAIVASIANLAQLQNAAGLVWRTLLWFAVTSLIAVAIGISLGLILQRACTPASRRPWPRRRVPLAPGSIS